MSQENTASASSATLNSDETFAAELHATATLVDVFSFPAPVAHRAVKTVGTDVTACFNYILDNGLASDSGGPIVPIDNCPHVANHVKVDGETQLPDPNHAPCTHYSSSKLVAKTTTTSKAGAKRDDSEESCPSTTENWLCLECAAVRCSRYVNAHGVEHYESSKQPESVNPVEQEGHCIALSLMDLSIWCYACGAYVADPSLKELLKRIEEKKFAKREDGAVDDSKPPPADNGSQPTGSSPNDNNADQKQATSQGSAQDEVAQDLTDKSSRDEPSRSSSSSAAAAAAADSSSSQVEKEKCVVTGYSEEISSTNNQGDTGKEDPDEKETDNKDPNSDSDSDSGDPSAFLHRAFPGLGGDEHDHDDDDIVYPFGEAPKSLQDVADFIRSENCQSIVILAGAGMSVASGIPDFRSSGGLYDTLQPHLLTATELERDSIRADPTAALEMGLFLQNPLPCLELQRPFILGTRDRLWKATLAHRFVELLHSKTGKLTRLYQQNIDGLEGQCTNLPREKIIMVHGNMNEAECGLCESKCDFVEFSNSVERNIKDLTGKDKKAPTESTPIACNTCGYETMKPSIVLFRSPLPKEFFVKSSQDIPYTDLLIVIGTSLAVAPANTLVFRCPRTTMRVICNREPVGYRFGIDYDTETAKRDYFAEGDIDSVLCDLACEMGWQEELLALVEEDAMPCASAQIVKERLSLPSPPPAEEENCTKKAKLDETGVAK